MSDGRHATTANLIAAVAVVLSLLGGGFWFLHDQIAAANQFHTDQRVRLWDRVENLDAQRELVSVQLAALKGEVSAVRATVEAIYHKLATKEE